MYHPTEGIPLALLGVALSPPSRGFPREPGTHTFSFMRPPSAQWGSSPVLGTAAGGKVIFIELKTQEPS